MDRPAEAVHVEDPVERDARVAEPAARITDDELSAEERLRDAYRLR